MIDQIAAREMAEQFIARQNLKGHTYKFSGVKFDERWPSEWGVVFDVYSPQNTLIDGPIVIVVDKTTGEARSM